MCFTSTRPHYTLPGIDSPEILQKVQLPPQPGSGSRRMRGGDHGGVPAGAPGDEAGHGAVHGGDVKAGPEAQVVVVEDASRVEGGAAEPPSVEAGALVVAGGEEVARREETGAGNH